jgi:exodeoxyribonuclease VII large subunit
MDKVFSVSEFISEVNALLAFPVAIEGEVSGFGISQGKWVYFSLKDEKEEALAPCFMTAWSLKIPIEDGMRVRVYGSPRIYPKTGKFSVTVERIEPVGEGALKRAFELMRKKLEEEGLFALERKRALPEFPEHVGLIASRESAACGDFLRIANNRWAGATIHLYHVQVQGQSAVEQIVEAFRYFSSPQAPVVEALVLIRGGGSLEDLQAFNSEEVVRAIYASRVPTVVGVGHERDESIADYVADVRASTPSNAAERLFPDKRETLSRIDYAVGRCRGGFETALTDARHRIGAAVQAVISAAQAQASRFENLATLIDSQLGRFLERLVHYKRSVEILARAVASLNPERLLSRGYAIVRRAGKIMKDASTLRVGEDIDVRLGKGSVDAEVKSINLSSSRGA